MIVALKTAGEELEITVISTPIDDSAAVPEAMTWSVGRALSERLLPGIEECLATQKATLSDLTGLIIFRGPGSFTSLRLGIATANALAYALQIPIVGGEGEDWIKRGLQDLVGKSMPQIITPFYGQDPHTTPPKK